MPQFVTNTMRVCTRDALGASYDASVPVRPMYSGNASIPSFGNDNELCAESAYDVPWSLEDAAAAENPAAQFSVGNVPMWDGTPVTSNPVYPADAYALQLDNTDPGEVCFVCLSVSILAPDPPLYTTIPNIYLFFLHLRGEQKDSEK